MITTSIAGFIFLLILVFCMGMSIMGWIMNTDFKKDKQKEDKEYEIYDILEMNPKDPFKKNLKLIITDKKRAEDGEMWYQYAFLDDDYKTFNTVYSHSMSHHNTKYYTKTGHYEN